MNGENSAFHKEWELLAYLASHSPDGVPVEKIAAAMWARSDPEAVVKNTLPPVASRLRTLLRQQVEELGNSGVVRIKKGICRLDTARLHSDAHRFLTLLEFKGSDRQAALEGAVALYRGDLLADSAWDWVYERPVNDILSPHERFRNAFFEAAQELAEMYLSQGRMDDAAGLYRRILELDPTQEETFLKLIECRKRAGQRAELERDGLWVRERIRDYLYDPDDPEDSPEQYDLEPEVLAAWERALTDLAELQPVHRAR